MNIEYTFITMKKLTQFKWGWKPTKKLEEILPLNEKGTAADLGCGCGGNSILLAKKGFRVMALDKRKEAIDCLKARLKGRKLQSAITIKKADLARSLWPKKQYSLILALNILHFLPNRRAEFLIRKMKTDLLPEGIIFIRIFSSKNRPRGKGYHPNQTELKKLFKDFKVLELQHYHVKDNHPPLGPHTHWILDLVAKKCSKKMASAKNRRGLNKPVG